MDFVTLSILTEVTTLPISTVPDVGDFVEPFNLIPVTVPAFLVNPQPLTVDSVGIVGLLLRSL